MRIKFRFLRTSLLTLAVLAFADAVLLPGSRSASQTGKWQEDIIESVSDDGSILKMASGHIFEIDDSDQVDTELWLPADDVLYKCTPVKLKNGGVVRLCTIINTDENSEKAEGEMLK